MDIAITSPFTLSDLIDLLSPSAKVTKKIYRNKQHFWADRAVLFVKFAKEEPRLLLDLQELLKTKFLIVVSSKKCKKNRLIFDGRFCNYNRYFKTRCFKFDTLESGRLLKRGSKSTVLGRVNIRGFKSLSTPLHKLLQAKAEFPDPETFEQLVNVLKNEGQHESVKVVLTVHQKCKTNWKQCDKPKLELDAFTTKGYKLAFRKLKHAKKIKIDNPQQISEEIAKNDENVTSNNNSSAVKVSLSGLNQALSLGCISEKEFKGI